MVKFTKIARQFFCQELLSHSPNAAATSTQSFRYLFNASVDLCACAWQSVVLILRNVTNVCVLAFTDRIARITNVIMSWMFINAYKFLLKTLIHTRWHTTSSSPISAAFTHRLNAILQVSTQLFRLFFTDRTVGVTVSSFLFFPFRAVLPVMFWCSLNSPVPLSN